MNMSREVAQDGQADLRHMSVCFGMRPGKSGRRTFTNKSAPQPAIMKTPTGGTIAMSANLQEVGAQGAHRGW